MEVGVGGSTQAAGSYGWSGPGGDIYHALTLFSIPTESTRNVLLDKLKLTYVIKNNSNFAAIVKIYKIKVKRTTNPAQASMLEYWYANSGSADNRWVATVNHPKSYSANVLHDYDLRMEPNFSEFFTVMKTKYIRWAPGETRVFTIKQPKYRRMMRADNLMESQFKPWMTRALFFQVTGMPVSETDTNTNPYTFNIGPANITFDINQSWTAKVFSPPESSEKSVSSAHVGQTWVGKGTGHQYQEGKDVEPTPPF